MEERISMVHGSGGAATSELIGAIFAKEFASDTLDKMEDSAVVEGAGRILQRTKLKFCYFTVLPRGKSYRRI